MNANEIATSSSAMKSRPFLRVFTDSKVHLLALFVLIVVLLKQQTTTVSDSEIFARGKRPRRRWPRPHNIRKLSIPKERPLSGKDRAETHFWVHRYLRWHESNRHNASRAAVFLPAENGGFGENVIGIVNMWGYAVITNRLLLINFTTPYPLGKLVSDRTRDEFMYTERDARRVGKVYSGNIRMPTGRKRTMWDGVVRLLRSSIPGIGLHLSNSDKPPDFARRAYRDRNVPEFSEAVKRSIARILLEPSEELLERKNALLSRNGFQDGVPYFAFHARLGVGIGEGGDPRFSSAAIKYDAIARCAAEKLARLSEPYMAVQVFISTDTPAFRKVFRKAMLRIAPEANVVAMEGERVEHFARFANGSTARSAAEQQVKDMHVENIILGNALEIVALTSRFSQVAYWRGTARRLYPLYYTFCAHSRKREFDI